MQNKTRHFSWTFWFCSVILFWFTALPTDLLGSPTFLATSQAQGMRRCRGKIGLWGWDVGKEGNHGSFKIKQWTFAWMWISVFFFKTNDYCACLYMYIYIYYFGLKDPKNHCSVFWRDLSCKILGCNSWRWQVGCFHQFG